MRLVEVKAVTKPRADRHHWRKQEDGTEHCERCSWVRWAEGKARAYRLATWPNELPWETHTRAPCCGPVPEPTPCGNRTCDKQVEPKGGWPQAYCSSECRKVAQQRKARARTRGEESLADAIAEAKAWNARCWETIAECRAVRLRCSRAWA